MRRAERVACLCGDAHVAGKRFDSCLCGDDVGRAMIRCDLCKHWYHLVCLGLDDLDIPFSEYACPKCDARNALRKRRAALPQSPTRLTSSVSQHRCHSDARSMNRLPRVHISTLAERAALLRALSWPQNRHSAPSMTTGASIISTNATRGCVRVAFHEERLASLPLELWGIIFTYLTLDDVGRLETTSTSMLSTARKSSTRWRAVDAAPMHLCAKSQGRVVDEALVTYLTARAAEQHAACVNGAFAALDFSYRNHVTLRQVRALLHAASPSLQTLSLRFVVGVPRLIRIFSPDFNADASSDEDARDDQHGSAGLASCVATCRHAIFAALKCLDLAGALISYDGMSLECIQTLAAGAPGLTHLSLAYAEGENGGAIAALFAAVGLSQLALAVVASECGDGERDACTRCRLKASALGAKGLGGEVSVDRATASLLRLPHTITRSDALAMLIAAARSGNQCAANGLVFPRLAVLVAGVGPPLQQQTRVQQQRATHADATMPHVVGSPAWLTGHSKFETHAVIFAAAYGNQSAIPGHCNGRHCCSTVRRGLQAASSDGLPLAESHSPHCFSVARLEDAVEASMQPERLGISRRDFDAILSRFACSVDNTARQLSMCCLAPFADATNLADAVSTASEPWTRLIQRAHSTTWPVPIAVFETGTGGTGHATHLAASQGVHLMRHGRDVAASLAQSAHISYIAPGDRAIDVAAIAAAREEVDTALSISSISPEHAIAAVQRLERGIPILANAMQAQPDEVAAVWLWASLLADRVYEWTLARELRERALHLTGESGTVAAATAGAMIQAGEMETSAGALEVEKWLDRAEQAVAFVDGTFHFGLEERGCIRLRQGLYEEGADFLRAALHFSPTTDGRDRSCARALHVALRRIIDGRPLLPVARSDHH